MQGYDKKIVAPAPLDGTACACPTLVAASEHKFDEALYADQGHRNHEYGAAQRATLALIATGFAPLALSASSGRSKYSDLTPAG